MRFEFHPDALEEYRQATLWYANRDPTLALQFIGSVEDAIKRVVDAPTSGESLTKTFVAA